MWYAVIGKLKNLKTWWDSVLFLGYAYMATSPIQVNLVKEEYLHKAFGVFKGLGTI